MGLNVQEVGASPKIFFFRLMKLVQVSSVQCSDPRNNLLSYKDDMLPVNLEQEQRKDVDIKKVVE